MMTLDAPFGVQQLRISEETMVVYAPICPPFGDWSN